MKLSKIGIRNVLILGNSPKRRRLNGAVNMGKVIPGF